jgi:anti-anti-sigma factor
MTSRRSDAAIAIEPEGPISSENAPQLRDRITAVLAATRPDRIIVDLRAVPTIDEAGLGALVSGYGAAAACDASLKIVDASPAVYERIRARGLTEMLA